MKYLVMIGLILGSCVWGMAQDKVSDNLLKNPSFEEGVKHWELPGWCKTLAAGPEVENSVIQGGGNGSLRLSCGEGKYAAAVQQVAVSGQDGNQYIFSGMVKTQNLTGGWTGRVLIECLYAKDGKNQVKMFSNGTAWNKPDNDWTPLTIEFTVPEHTTAVRVWLRMISPNGNGKPVCGGTVWFDNVALVKKIAPEAMLSAAWDKKKAVNLLPGKPGFEKFRSLGWIKDSVEPREKGDTLVFEGKPGKRGYLANFVRPSNLEVERYVFTVEVDNRSTASEWKPVGMLEMVYLKDGKQSYAYHQGIWSNNGKTLTVSAPPIPGLKEIRAILGTTVLPANFSGNSGTIVYSTPRLAALCRKNGLIYLEKIRPTLLGGIYQPEEQVELLLQVFCGKKQDSPVRIEYEVRDFNGKVMTQGKSSECFPGGSLVEMGLPLARWTGTGFFSVKCRLVTAENEVSEMTASVVIAPGVKRPDPFFAMCHFGFPVEYYPAARRLGCGSTTLIFYRSQIEKQPGVYDFSEVGKKIARAGENGFELFAHMPIYAGNYAMDPDWLNRLRKPMGQKGYTPEYFQGLRDYYAQCLAFADRQVTGWSCVNEIDLSHHSSPFAEMHYVEASKIFYEEVKKVNPDWPVIGLSVSGVDASAMFPYARKLLPRIKDSLDGIGPDAHVVPCTYGPGYRPVSEEKGQFRETLIALRRLADSAGKKIISIEEKGYLSVSSLPPDHESLKKQAAVMARGVVLARAFGCLRWVPFYAVCNDVAKTDYGMWRMDNPRPILAAYAAAARLLAFTGKPIEVLPRTDIYAYVFRRGGKTVAVWWTTSEEPVNVSWQLPADAVIYNTVGAPMTFESRLTEFPVYVETSLAPESLAKLITDASYTMPELAGEILCRSGRELEVALLNKTAKPLTVEISGFLGMTSPKKAILPGGKMVGIPVTLPRAIQSRELFSGLVSTASGQYPLTKTVELTPVRKLTGVKLDGSLDSFKGVEPIVLDQVQHLLPVDAAANKLWTGVDDLSLKIYLGYDDRYFYIGAAVKDDVSRFTQSGLLLWNQDAFQISFDPLSNAVNDSLAAPGYQPDDWDYAFAQGKNGPEVFCYKAGDSSAGDQGKKQNYPLVIKRISEQLIHYELAIPWNGLAPLRPLEGSVFGFNLCYFDDDGAGPLYNMAISGGTSNGKNPSLYKKFILSE